ncbi:bifunctional folylpolyglutamate synthase/dihydrofolate synthase [Lapillicoccus jejuensis]|uniref:tetrahydrofolate synthase n=1 Tax=Lapillicoccus jejuensis TaxID=402171 RepID=A0A542E3T3_9MICO|nr:cyanophycin synthetase [Lapillicoccus jejuensis]TQJ10000.1 dihydrofolate synthase/folylpolyglutamate synthase [Lapillicoccus jejuensis]
MSPSGRPDAAQQEAARRLEVEKRVRQVEAEILARAPETHVDPSLDEIRAVMELLGDPQHTFPVIHLTGTNGKTTTARMVEALLREAGLTTGRFTSPHLHSFRERISIGGEPISAERLVEVYDEVLPMVQLADARSVERGGGRLNFFMMSVVLAYAAFADAPVDVGVVEVGLGGRWDATNVADGQVAVVTPVDLDHTRLLGDTVEEIATEKSGIIKPGAIAVSAVQERDVAEILVERSQEVGARPVFEGVDFGVVAREVALGGQLLTLKGLAGEYPEVFVPLHGEHMASNAAVALAAVEAFLGGGETALDADVVRAGFASVTSPGRLEVVRRSPTVLVDAAHNPAGARALRAALDDAFTFTRLVGVVAIFADKEPLEMLEILEPALDHVVVTRNSSPRSIPPDELGRIAVEVFGEDRVTVVRDLPDALDRAAGLAESTGDASGMGSGVLVTGSVVTAADARMLLGHTDT